MPFRTLEFDPRFGPIIDVQVAVSAPTREMLKAIGQSIPVPIPVRLLIDTGASGTCLDPEVLKLLGVTPRGSAAIHSATTAGMPQEVPEYDVGIYLPIGNRGEPYFLGALSVLALKLADQGIQGLLGRDVLCRGLFTINGSANIFLLGI